MPTLKAGAECLCRVTFLWAILFFNSLHFPSGQGILKLNKQYGFCLLLNLRRCTEVADIRCICNLLDSFLIISIKTYPSLYTCSTFYMYMLVLLVLVE